jgi:hypothetical protein
VVQGLAGLCAFYMQKHEEEEGHLPGENAYMSSLTSTIGNQIDVKAPIYSQSCNISHAKAQTISDLLAALPLRPTL